MVRQLTRRYSCLSAALEEFYAQRSYKGIRSIYIRIRRSGLAFCHVGILYQWRNQELDWHSGNRTVNIDFLCAASTNVREATFKIGALEATFWFLTLLSLAVFVYALINPTPVLFMLAIAVVGLTLSYLRITSKFIYDRVKCGPVLSWF